VIVGSGGVGAGAGGQLVKRFTFSLVLLVLCGCGAAALSSAAGLAGDPDQLAQDATSGQAVSDPHTDPGQDTPDAPATPDASTADSPTVSDTPAVDPPAPDTPAAVPPTVDAPPLGVLDSDQTGSTSPLVDPLGFPSLGWSDFDNLFSLYLDGMMLDYLTGGYSNGSMTYLERLCIEGGTPEYTCRRLYGN
jgi:hypothetical protein